MRKEIIKSAIKVLIALFKFNYHFLIGCEAKLQGNSTSLGLPPIFLLYTNF